VRKPEFDLLQKAAAMTFPAPVGPGGTGVGSTPAAPPKPPDFHAVLSDPAGRATGALDRIQQVTSDGLRISADNAQAGLRDLGSRLDRAAIAETRLSDATLGQNLAKVRRESTALAENLIVGEQVRPETGLEAIATAYEGWLSGGGMDTLLGKITAHFATKEGQAGPAQRVAEGVMDRPRATVQIDEVVIEVDGPATLREQPAGQPAPAAPEPSGIRDFPDPPDRDHVEQLARWLFDRDQRGAGGRLPIPT
jgi:hypothetical protein